MPTTTLPRAVRLLVAGRSVNQLGAFTLPFLTVLLTERFHTSLGTVTALLAVFGVATLVSRLAGARFAMSFGSRGAIVLGLVLTAVAQLTLAAAGSLPVAVAAVLAFGLVSEIYEPASQALVARLTPAADRQRAYSFLAAAVGGAGVLAGLLATAAASVDVRLVFVTDAVSCLLAAGVLHLGLRSAATESIDHGPNLPTGFGKRRALAPRVGQIPSPWRDPRLLALAGSGLVFAAVYLQLNATLPLTLQQRGHPGRQIGLLVALSAAVVLAGQPLLRRPPLAQLTCRQALTAGYALLGLGLAGLGVARSLWQFALAVFVCALGDLLVLGRSLTLVAAVAPRDGEEDYFAVYGLTWGLAAVVGPPAGTALLRSAGPGVLWFCCAAVSWGLACAQGRVVVLTSRPHSQQDR